MEGETMDPAKSKFGIRHAQCPDKWRCKGPRCRANTRKTERKTKRRERSGA